MKKILTASALAAFVGTSAFAGSAGPVVMDAPVEDPFVPAAATGSAAPGTALAVIGALAVIAAIAAGSGTD